MKNVNTVEVQRAIRLEGVESARVDCERTCLTAFGTGEVVNVIDMRGDVRTPIKIIKRPKFSSSMSFPTMAWGYGLTPIETKQA